MPEPMWDADSGVQIEDLLTSREFLSRRRKVADPNRIAKGRQRLDRCLAERPGELFQELAQAAVDLSDADSSGVSLEEPNDNGELQFRWVAVAGSFSRYLNGTTPRFYSPCGTCLDRGSAQLYRVTNPYYNFLGVSALPILDGLLLPWRRDRAQGTIWLISHRTAQAFDAGDYEFLQDLGAYISRAMTMGHGEDRARESA